MDLGTNRKHCINRLFYSNKLDLQQDYSFISSVVRECNSVDTLSAFITFMEKQDADISGFSKIIKEAVESLGEGFENWEMYGLEDKLVRVVI